MISYHSGSNFQMCTGMCGACSEGLMSSRGHYLSILTNSNENKQRICVQSIWSTFDSKPLRNQRAVNTKEQNLNYLKLNRLEDYLLKPVIPFIRIGHLPRGRYFQLKGELIMISADVIETMKRILPVEQNLIPVSFKKS